MTGEAVSRRSVIHGLVVTVAAGIAGYLFARNSDAARAKSATSGANGYGPAPGSGGAFLARLDQVPPDGGLVIAPRAVVLTRGLGATVHGFSAICTHQGCTVGQVQNGTIDCPCHGSRFNARTGAVVAGPATRALPVVP